MLRGGYNNHPWKLDLADKIQSNTTLFNRIQSKDATKDMCSFEKHMEDMDTWINNLHHREKINIKTNQILLFIMDMTIAQSRTGNPLMVDQKLKDMLLTKRFLQRQ